jgi:hypothetical protein
VLVVDLTYGGRRIEKLRRGDSVEPANNRFGGGATVTLLHPVVAVAMVIAIALMFLLPRKYAVVPLLAAGMLVPLGQQVVLGGVHFTVLRIITVFGLIRWVALDRASGTGRLAREFNPVDKSFVLWALSYTVCFALLYMDGQALINRLGSLLDALGGYFLLRHLIEDDKDVRRVIRVFIVIAAIMAVCMVSEHLTQQNVFGLLGGTKPAPDVRDGQIRANGAFQHSILAGCFGATLLPLFVALWKDRNSRTAALLGLVSSTTIMATAGASTAVLAYAAGIVGLCFWPLRERMRAFRWGLVFTLVGLHLVMKAPVWALIARIDLTGSSSGYHRFMLVDNLIRHFGDWWLVGAKNYNNWGWDMWDLSNQYVAYGVTGGLATLVFFIAIISRSFGRLGTARKCAAGEGREEWLLWCLAAALFAHVVAYFGIGYFDQTEFAWFALLAMISAATSEAMRPTAELAETVDDLWNGEAPALSVTNP